VSHDLWAGLTSVELARDCLSTPSNWFSAAPPWAYQTYALKDPKGNWPIADGTIEVEELPHGSSRLVAVEFKRVNEGVHGILTGIGQVQAYLRKGFVASVLVLPRRYDSLEEPGSYASSVLSSSAPASPIGVFTYDDPDFTHTSPFRDRLTCLRPVSIDPVAPLPPVATNLAAGRSRTQWAHVREGSTVPDYYYRYLTCVMDVLSNPAPYSPEVRGALRQAVGRIGRGLEPRLFLSDTRGDRLSEEAWRRFWFRFVVPREVQRIWTRGDEGLEVDRTPTGLRQWNGDQSVFFARPGSAGRSKPQLLEALVRGEKTPTEVWDVFAKSIADRAHSLKEDIDSGIEAAGLIDADGHLTHTGFRFVRAADRASRNANAPGPLSVLRWAFLVEGNFAALLHYVHRLSDDLFRADPMTFSHFAGGTFHFDSVPYRTWLADKLVDELHVAARSSMRGGRTRPPLEAELILLRKLGLISDWRIGLGIEINWPAVHSALEIGRD
jgi:hypothetical protein